MKQKFTAFANHEGDYTICYDLGGLNETVIGYERRLKDARHKCDLLNTILNIEKQLNQMQP